MSSDNVMTLSLQPATTTTRPHTNRTTEILPCLHRDRSTYLDAPHQTIHKMNDGSFSEGAPTMAHQNSYKSNLRDLSFLLFEQFHLQDLLGKAPFANWGKDEVTAVVEQAYEWVQQYLGPLTRSGDDEGCRLVDGQVRVPAG